MMPVQVAPLRRRRSVRLLLSALADDVFGVRGGRRVTHSSAMSAKVTLDTYADLFDDDLDAVAVTLDSRYSRERVAKMWPRGSEDIR